jgi:hypothetical protein
MALEYFSENSIRRFKTRFKAPRGWAIAATPFAVLRLPHVRRAGRPLRTKPNHKAILNAGLDNLRSAAEMRAHIVVC